MRLPWYTLTFFGYLGLFSYLYAQITIFIN